MYQKIVGIILILFGVNFFLFNEKFQNLIWIGKFPFGKSISQSPIFSSPVSKKLAVYFFGLMMILLGLASFLS